MSNRIFKSMICAAALSAVLFAGHAHADSPPIATNAVVVMAAADAAGWVVFPNQERGDTEDARAITVRLSQAINPDRPSTPAMDWLDRWGIAQAAMQGR